MALLSEVLKLAMGPPRPLSCENKNEWIKNIFRKKEKEKNYFKLRPLKMCSFCATKTWVYDRLGRLVDKSQQGGGGGGGSESRLETKTDYWTRWLRLKSHVHGTCIRRRSAAGTVAQASPASTLKTAAAIAGSCGSYATTLNSKLQALVNDILPSRKVPENDARSVAQLIRSVFVFLFHSSGAVWESRWTSWAVRPNEPSGFRGRKDLLNRASALVTTCP